MALAFDSHAHLPFIFLVNLFLVPESKAFIIAYLDIVNIRFALNAPTKMSKFISTATQAEVL